MQEKIEQAITGDVITVHKCKITSLLIYEMPSKQKPH